MENQVRQLKLNVTNIKSYLFNSNKELRKLQVKKNNLFSKLQKQEEFRKEEKRIETKNVKSGLGRIAGAVVAPARSFFDRMLDFFGLIALGILVNKLPEIIKGITDIAERIENFFNSDFMKNLTSILETVGTAFTNLGRFIGLLPEDKQNEYEKALRDEIDKKLDEDLNTNMDTSEMDLKELEKLLENLGGDVEKLNKELDQDKNPDESQNQWWDFLDVFPNQQPEVTAPEPQQSASSPEPSSQQQTSPEPTPEPTPEPNKPKPPQGYSRGGTVRSDGENQESTQVYQPRKSGKLKRAQRSANEGFTEFPLAVDNINNAIEKDEENMMAFVEMSKKFRELSILSEKDKKDKKLKSPGSPGSVPDDDLRGASRGYSTGNIPIDPGKKIVGYVGSTGRSTGPHIHIETGNGYSGSGGNIPAEVLDNIIVDGKPLSQHPRGAELGDGRGHRGFDYPIRKGAPIQLQGGLKFVDFDEVADPGGYGKNIVITDKNGNPYLIGHLSAGPEDPKEFEKRREEARKKQQKKQAKRDPETGLIVQPIPPGAGFTLEPVSPDGITVEPAEKEKGTAYIIFGKLYYFDESGGGTIRNSDGKVINPESLSENFLRELKTQIKSKKKQPTPKLRGPVSSRNLSSKNNTLIASASGMPQSLVVVYAIQPREVPFPYPIQIPIAQEVKSSPVETPQLPSIWRSIA